MKKIILLLLCLAYLVLTSCSSSEVVLTENSEKVTCRDNMECDFDNLSSKETLPLLILSGQIIANGNSILLTVSNATLENVSSELNLSNLSIETDGVATNSIQINEVVFISETSVELKIGGRPIAKNENIKLNVITKDGSNEFQFAGSSNNSSIDACDYCVSVNACIL